MCIEASTFAIELALIEYFINELLLILIIWNEPFTIKYTKISYYFIVKILTTTYTITLSSSTANHRSYCGKTSIDLFWVCAALFTNYDGTVWGNSSFVEWTSC
jgi:hypothetical protein